SAWYVRPRPPVLDASIGDVAVPDAPLADQVAAEQAAGAYDARKVVAVGDVVDRRWDGRWRHWRIASHRARDGDRMPLDEAAACPSQGHTGDAATVARTVSPAFYSI